MEDLTKIKGVLGYCLYQDDSPVSGAQAGKLGDNISEIEQFWSSAASVIANNLKLEQVKEVILSGKDRQVMMILKGDSLMPERSFDMAFEDAIKASKIAGLKVAFFSDKSGVCCSQDGLKNDIVQSTQLLQQIYDIVGQPGLNNIIISSDKDIFWGRLTGAGVAGAVVPGSVDLPAVSRLLDDLSLPSGSAGGPALPAGLIAQMRKVATEYLSDFAETALMVQLKQAGVNEQNPTADQIQKLAAGLEKAALMIVGPSQGKEMGQKLKKLF